MSKLMSSRLQIYIKVTEDISESHIESQWDSQKYLR